MCIIAIKKSGVSIPEQSTLLNMWTSNSDGAGFMYPYKNKVKIEKGFMKFNDFIEALNRVRETIDTDKTPMVFHFRIGTHGGNIPQNTHPFPVCDSESMLKKLTTTVDVGVAHNGIIHSVTPRKGISDTMEYILSQMCILKKLNRKFYLDDRMCELMENAVESKLAFLDKSGKIKTIGNFVTDEATGMIYSNTSYQPRMSYSSPSTRSYHGGMGWSMYDWDWDFDETDRRAQYLELLDKSTSPNSESEKPTEELKPSDVPTLTKYHKNFYPIGYIFLDDEDEDSVWFECGYDIISTYEELLMEKSHSKMLMSVDKCEEVEGYETSTGEYEEAYNIYMSMSGELYEYNTDFGVAVLRPDLKKAVDAMLRPIDFKFEEAESIYAVEEPVLLEAITDYYDGGVLTILDGE